MPRTSERGGPQTRARILETAARLFFDNGYDQVTVAQIAREAGVSSVTVFNHFPRKEDLFLDRATDADDLLRAAVRDREPGVSPIDSLHEMALRLADEQNALSGLQERSIPFFRTVAGSPALIARAREIGAELQRTLREALEADPAFDGPADLLAAFVIAGYSTVLVENATRLVGGDDPASLAVSHRERLGLLFDALRDGLAHPAG